MNAARKHINNDTLFTCTQAAALVSLLLVLKLGLLPALLSGLLIYQLVHLATPLFGRIGIVPAVGKVLTLATIAAIVVTSIVVGVAALTSFLNSGTGVGALLQKMADIVSTARTHLPVWAQNYLPSDMEDMQSGMAEWLREHASQLSHIGQGIGTSLVYILMGMVIGGMVAFSRNYAEDGKGPLTHLLYGRATLLNSAFRRIVFSQVRISAINTLLTSIFLLGILPMFGIHLPLVKAMIAVTFIVGLLPVIGNLISNTVIVLVSLGVSLGAAIGALAFLVVIHKLEYFLNAHIIGTNIRARAWEILLAMLVMEAAFGLNGIIAAPIYYAYLKDELGARKLL